MMVTRVLTNLVGSLLNHRIQPVAFEHSMIVIFPSLRQNIWHRSALRKKDLLWFLGLDISVHGQMDPLVSHQKLGLNIMVEAWQKKATNLMVSKLTLKKSQY